MLIRCEKCSTLYELDDKLIPAGGAPVQCSKCQFVFRAYPPAPEETAAPTPAPTPVSFDRGGGGSIPTSTPTATANTTANTTPTPSPTPNPRPSQSPRPTQHPNPSPSAFGLPDAPPADPPRSSPALRAPTSGPGPDAKFTPDGRPIRKVPFPADDEGAAGGAPRTPFRPAPRAPVPVKPRPGVPRWVLPAVVVALLLVAAAVYGAWRVLSRRGRPQAASPVSGVPSEIAAVASTSPPWGTPGATAENAVAHRGAERGS